MMIHKGLKPFQCNICQKKFREKSNYNFHLKKHNKKFDFGKNNRNGINKSNSFSKNEIDFYENEFINKENKDIKNISILKDQDLIFTSNNSNLKDSGNDIVNINNQPKVINIQNNIDKLYNNIIFIFYISINFHFIK